jgi:hypothetical protein
VLVALGVAGMHTLGHAHTSHVGAPHGAGPHTMVMAASARAAQSAVETTHVAVIEAMGGVHVHMNPLDVCVAILTAFGLALLLAALLTRVRRAGRIALAGTPTRSAHGRDPPRDVPPLNRRLASLSVLRI